QYGHQRKNSSAPFCLVSAPSFWASPKRSCSLNSYPISRHPFFGTIRQGNLTVLALHAPKVRIVRKDFFLLLYYSLYILVCAHRLPVCCPSVAHRLPVWLPASFDICRNLLGLSLSHVLWRFELTFRPFPGRPRTA